MESKYVLLNKENLLLYTDRHGDILYFYNRLRATNYANKNLAKDEWRLVELPDKQGKTND